MKNTASSDLVYVLEKKWQIECYRSFHLSLSQMVHQQNVRNQNCLKTLVKFFS